MPDDMHVFWVRPLPGVTNTERVIVAIDNIDQTSVVVVLPDDTQVLITADRAVHIKGSQSLVLSAWQYSPVSPDEYYQDTAPMQIPEIPAGDYQAPEEEPPGRGRGPGTYTLSGRPTFG